MCKKILLLFLGLQLTVSAQIPKTSIHEWTWALGHPFAALKVKKITKKCNKLIPQTNLNTHLDNYSNGGQLDAYRHTFYMAAYSQKVKPKKLRKLGQAHEKTNYRQFKKHKKEDGEIADSLSSVMDLKNNELGFKIGVENRNESLEALSVKVIEEIKKGNAFIMKRNSAGAYLDCEGNVIDLKEYKKVWNVPKCLVRSTSM
jgi:hypothetical protein